MAITANEFMSELKDAGLNYNDRGVDKHGDHVFLSGIVTDHYKDADGDNSIQFIIELSEAAKVISDNDKERLAELRGKKSSGERLSPEEMEELVDLLDRPTDPAYEYLRFLIAPVQLPEQAKQVPTLEKIKIANQISLKLKLTNLAVDDDGDFIYNYGIPLETEGKIKGRQVLRMISVISNMADELYKSIAV